MSYNSLTIHGGSDVNYLIAYDEVLNSEQTENLASEGVHTPEWDERVFLRATFNNNLSASNFEAGKLLSGYSVQKEIDMDGVLRPVAETDSENQVVRDYNIASTKSYRYWIFPQVITENGSTAFGAPIITENIEYCLDGWSIAGLQYISDNAYEVDSDNVWNFSLNIENPSYDPQFSKTVHNGFGRYPKMTSTKSNYMKINLSALLGSISCSGLEYQGDDIDRIEAWREFCASDCLKLLRSPKGHVMIGDVETTSYDIDDTTIQSPTTISFTFVELASANDVMIYELEG